MRNKLKLPSLQNRPNLLRAVQNMGWLLFDKLFRLGASFIVTLWLARYLAPELFGVYNYAIALVALLSVLASLGLNTLIVQRLVQFPQAKLQTLGASFVIQLLGGVVAFVVGLLLAWGLSSGNSQVFWAVAVLSASNLFRFSDVVRAYFEAEVRSKHLVITENLVFVFVLLARVLMILQGAHLLGFVFLLVLEAALTALAFVCLLGRRIKLSALTFPASSVKALFHATWPLALSSLAIMLYMRVDQVMLGVLIDQNAVGVYSAAVRISEIWYFLPTVIVSSVFPRIIHNMSANGNDSFEARSNVAQTLVLLLSALSLMAYLVAALVSVFSASIIAVLYGSQYAASASVLQVHVWSAVFVFSGVVGARWLVAQGLQRFLFVSTAVGALLNVALNFYLIPLYGPQGAAWATLFAQLGSALLMNACHPVARGLFKMQCKGLVLLQLGRLLRAWAQR